MARINRHERIGSKQHLGKAMIADLDFKNGTYRYRGEAVAVDTLLASDAQLLITFNSGTDITAGSGLTDDAAFTGALLADCIGGATYVLDMNFPNITAQHFYIEATNGTGFATDWFCQDTPSSFGLYVSPPATATLIPLAYRPQIGFNRLACTLAPSVVAAAANGSAPLSISPTSPANGQGIAHVGVSMLAGAVAHRLRVYRTVQDMRVLQALSRI